MSTTIPLGRNPRRVRATGMATRVVAAAMAVVMLAASGCGGSGADDTDAVRPGPRPVTAEDAAMVDALRAPPFTAANVSVVVDLLERSGVGVYPDDAADGVEPVRLTGWQVSNLAVEAANGGGVAGHLLGELAPLPDGAPPISYLLAAWVLNYPSPAAGFARALMGEQDWHHAEQVVFPKLLLTLFVADREHRRLAASRTPGRSANASSSGTTRSTTTAASLDCISSLSTVDVSPRFSTSAWSPTLFDHDSTWRPETDDTPHSTNL